jgi:hypothetical protein
MNLSRLAHLSIRSRCLCFSLALLGFLLLSSTVTLAASSVNVPLDSWAYEALDTLEGYGLIDSALSSTRPYSKLETARLAGEAIKNWEAHLSRQKPMGFGEQELIPTLLNRFKREFQVELVELGILEGSRSDSFFKPVNQMIQKYVWQKDGTVTRPQLGSVNRQTIAPVYNNDGIIYRKQNNFSTELQGEARLWNHFSLYYQPIFKAFEGEGARVELEKGYLKAEAYNVEIEAGRDSLWWGPGRNGALLMTNNAPPFDLVKLSSPQPFKLPFLGLFKFNLFLSKLDNTAPYITSPQLYGLHLDFKPHPNIEVGLSQVAIFGGEGRKISLGDYFRILYSNQNLEGNLESNQQLSVDISWRWPNMGQYLPVARSLKAYAEWGAEDTGIFPDRRAYLLGLFFADFLKMGRMDLRFEYANTTVPAVPSAWYQHNYYPPTYRGLLFGHHLGGNGEELFARLNYHLSTKLQLGLDFDYANQGVYGTNKTSSQQLGIDLNYWIRERMNIKGRYILQGFYDPDRIAGGDKILHVFGLEFRWRF